MRPPADRPPRNIRGPFLPTTTAAFSISRDSAPSRSRRHHPFKVISQIGLPGACGRGRSRAISELTTIPPGWRADRPAPTLLSRASEITPVTAARAEPLEVPSNSASSPLSCAKSTQSTYTPLTCCALSRMASSAAMICHQGRPQRLSGNSNVSRDCRSRHVTAYPKPQRCRPPETRSRCRVGAGSAHLGNAPAGAPDSPVWPLAEVQRGDPSDVHRAARTMAAVQAGVRYGDMLPADAGQVELVPASARSKRAADLPVLTDQPGRACSSGEGRRRRVRVCGLRSGWSSPGVGA